MKIRRSSTRILATVLLAAAALAALACLAGCGRHTYEGVDLSQYVPERYLDDVMESLDRAGDNAPAVLEALLGEAADVRVVPPGDGRLTTEAGHTIDFAAELPVVLIYETESAGASLRHEGYDLNIERVVTAAIDEFTGRRPTK